MAARVPPVMNPDGTVNIDRLGLHTSWWRDLYHFMLKTGWSQALLLICSAYIAINLLFAALLWWPGDAVEGVRPGAFFDVFFFSIQTFSTIGYGGMSPVGLYGHVIVTIEAMVSLLFTAMATGLLFAKFATPTSRVRFSRTAVIGMHNGKRTLIFRMANERSNQIVEASMNVVVIRTEQTQEGEQLRRFYDLKLRRHRSPIFSLGWTAYHTIDSDSPLADATPESLAADESTVLVSLSGTDSTLWQTVYARHAYSWNEIEFDRRFVDLVQVRQDGSRMIDYAEFHSTVPADDSGAVTSLVG